MKEVQVDLRGVNIMEQQRMLADSIGSNIILGVSNCTIQVWTDGTVSVVIDGLNALTIHVPKHSHISAHYDKFDGR